MTIDESNKRQQKLENVLKKMAVQPYDQPETLRPIALELKDVYSNGFRHSYAKFFPLIVEMSKDENVYNTAFLSESLFHIQEFVENDISEGREEFNSILSSLSKLCDHLCLEIERFDHYTVFESSTQDLLACNEQMQTNLTMAQTTIDDLSTKANGINTKTDDIQKSVDRANRKITNMQIEYTTILGIFAAIILAFTGSFSFSSSVLENIHQSSVYRLILITLIVGFITLNSIFILIDFIIRINDIKKEKPNNNSKINWNVVIFDLIVALGIAATCLAYRCDFFGTQVSTKSATESNAQPPDDLTTSESPVLDDSINSPSQGQPTP